MTDDIKYKARSLAERAVHNLCREVRRFDEALPLAATDEGYHQMLALKEAQAREALEVWEEILRRVSQ